MYNNTFLPVSVTQRVLAAVAIIALILSTFGLTLVARVYAAPPNEVPSDPSNAPTTKDDCKNGGWEGYGFTNQGMCIKYVHGLNNDNGGGNGGGGNGDDDTSTVTIVKYVDGEMATAEGTDDASFAMESSWDDPAGIGTSNGSYTLSPSGYNSATAYTAVTSEMTTDDADYTTHEVLDGEMVDEECQEEGGPDYKLVGYTWGDSLHDAEEATPTMTAPDFTDLEDDMYVIVWNETCDGDNDNGGNGGNSNASSTVTIIKYLDGVHATSGNASGTAFAMYASWDDADGIGTGNGNYNLDAGGGYEAITAQMTTGQASYATNEVLDGNTVGAACQEEGGPDYALVGYTTGNTLAQAQGATPGTTSPSFAHLANNKYVIVWNETCDDNGQGGGGDDSATSTVTIIKYLDGVHATAGNASSSSFAMQASWSDPNGIGTGSGSYNLNAGGGYEAMTAAMTTDEADYATNEVIDGTLVGNSCTASSSVPAYRLVGYTTGGTLAQAQSGTPTTTSPALTNISGNKFIIVWNATCNDDGQGGGGDDSAPTLTLVKHASGGNGTFSFNITGATATTSMLTTVGGWATTSPIMLNTGTSTLSEVQSIGWITSDISCTYENDSIGYSLSSTSEQIHVDENDDVVCTIHNTATSTGTTSDAALHVDSIDALKTTAIANDSYGDGWQYLFHITTPNNEENLSMRFSDWVGQNASNTIPVANNMRISSAQASSTSAITLTGSNVYSTPMVMTTDLNSGMAGRQVDVLVEVKIPIGTQNDTYLTTYGVQTLP